MLGFVQADEMVQSPFEDVVGRVQVGVHAHVTLLALEVRLAFTVSTVAITTFTACLACVRGVDEYETVSSGQLGFVFEFADDSTKACRT